MESQYSHPTNTDIKTFDEVIAKLSGAKQELDL